jgi:kinesin family protein 6/9
MTAATAAAPLPRVTLLEDEEGDCHLRNLSMHLVRSEEEALNLLFLGDTNRAISATAMNQVRVRRAWQDRTQPHI